MLKKIYLAFLILSASLFSSLAEEGMWIPMMLEKYAIGDMNSKGLKLSASDIYDINQACLKDAIVIFGTGCTGELVSEEGLVLTNHHCGFSYIQSQSSLERDLISQGFWAMSREEELPNPRLTVTFLIRIEDVTTEILNGTSTAITEQQRDNIIEENLRRVSGESIKNTEYRAVIKPFYYGLEYYMFIYQEYKDVRLVGAPPSTIGNFGVDTDNWVWPRHTGDFSLFRIYADKNNNPAAYSPENVPYKPRKFLSVSLNGYQENDFTMVMGYPGTTTEYLISDGVKIFTELTFPKKVDLREKRMEILAKYMEKDDRIRIQYASKYRSISNMWKKWQGVIDGVKKYKAVEQKELIEERFEKWVSENPEKREKYVDVLNELKDLYRQLSIYILVNEYSGENVLATEIMSFASDIRSFLRDNESLADSQKVVSRDKFIQQIRDFYKDYDPLVDTEVFQCMLENYHTYIDPAFYPDFYAVIKKKYKGNFKKFAEVTLGKTFLTSKDRVLELFQSYPDNESIMTIRFLEDPVMRILNSYSAIYNDEILAKYNFLTKEINRTYRTYIEGLKEMDPALVFYPDANFTMRVTYGKVEGYSPSDAVTYDYYTTLEGVIEKQKLAKDYAIPSTLYQLSIRKDYGPWKNREGQMPVCFIASNHTSGGNSGSPVLDANGNLIGLNFDRNWEGTMSDIWYDKTICRNISVDIRYILFIIDKFAGAGHLIDEMDVIWE